VTCSPIICAGAHRPSNLRSVKAWLSPAGTLSALAVGSAVWIGIGWRGFLLLLTFFVTASALTRGGGRRRPVQVFANGGVAALCALLARADGAFVAAFAGAIAAAAADTWSTEIGGRFGGTPRSLVTWRMVAPGTSGGITVAGNLGGLAAALLIGMTTWAAGLTTASGAARVAAAGIAGALADSLLGATVQARWRCPSCGATIETPRHGCEAAGEPMSGWRWLDNDAVNAVATLVGALVAALPVFPAGALLP